MRAGRDRLSWVFLVRIDSRWYIVLQRKTKTISIPIISLDYYNENSNKRDEDGMVVNWTRILSQMGR